MTREEIIKKYEVAVEGLGGILQALRTVWPLGKEEPQRCDSGVERHDSGEKEGAKP